MIEVVSLFREQDTRDELGIGSIRDALADFFFPGTTTLQTRARYFLLVPWMYTYYENRKVSSEKIAGRLRQDEIRLIDTLKEAGETGVIGERSGISLHRFPSSIYWKGLQRWGVCRFLGTTEQYHRSLDRWYEGNRQSSQADDYFSPGQIYNWDPDLPVRPAEDSAGTHLSLTVTEARYLRECLRLNCTGSLITVLVENTDPVDDTVTFPWLHPQMDMFPLDLKDKLEHARNFSESIHGAALLYNLMLAEKADQEELVTNYSEELQTWWNEMNLRSKAWKKWDRLAFWSFATCLGRIPYMTQSFADRWLDALLGANGITKPEKSKTMMSLVENRERSLKRARSRFVSQRHLELWSGAASAGQIDFRWRVAKGITNDILRGLNSNRKDRHARSR